MRHTYAIKDRALKAAEAKLEEVINGAEKLDSTIVGNPTISAEARVFVNNLSKKADGE